MSEQRTNELLLLVIECLKDAHRVLTDLDASDKIDLAYIRETIAKAEDRH